MKNRFLLGLMLFVTGCIVGGFAVYAINSQKLEDKTITDKSQQQTKAGYHGIDVSNHQGLIGLWSQRMGTSNLSI